MNKNNESPFERTEIEFFEFSRRWDVVKAVINHAAENLGEEMVLNKKMQKHNKRLSNPWFWIFFIFSLGIDAVLRETRWYEFKLDFNFGTFMVGLCIFYYIGFKIDKLLIEREQNANYLRRRELDYRWEVAVGSCGSLRDLKKFINSNGDIEGDGFAAWNNEVYENLSNKVKYLPLKA